MRHKKESTFNWDLALKNASGKPDLAIELTCLFLELLPKHETELRLAYEKKDLDALGKAAHKLHGALCYCGLPRLKSLTKTLESTARNAKGTINRSIDKLYRSLQAEIQAIYKFRPTFEETWKNQKIQK